MKTKNILSISLIVSFALMIGCTPQPYFDIPYDENGDVIFTGISEVTSDGITAADNDLPVVPITLRGTRSILRSADWFPRRGSVAVIIGEPLDCGGQDWNAALEVRNKVRRQILRHLGEPDLAGERALTG